jgi:hypothetical protein
MAMSLYEIDSRIKAIIDNLYEAADENGEVDAEIDFSELKQLQEDRKTKLENIALYIKNTEAEAKAIKEEEEKLKTRRERLENRADRLRDLMITSMQEAKEPELETARCKARIKDNEVTEIINEDLIPEEFIKVKIKRDPDKTAIKKAIKAGTEVAGATLGIHTTIKID